MASVNVRAPASPLPFAYSKRSALMRDRSLTPLVVYFMMLTDFKTRISVLFNWTTTFLGREGAQQAITAHQVFARHALEEHARERGTALPIPMTARRDGATP
jgi:hypothetical protein